MTTCLTQYWSIYKLNLKRVAHVYPQASLLYSCSCTYDYNTTTSAVTLILSNTIDFKCAGVLVLQTRKLRQNTNLK